MVIGRKVPIAPTLCSSVGSVSIASPILDTASTDWTASANYSSGIISSVDGTTSGLPSFLIGRGKMLAVAGFTSPIGTFTGLIRGVVGINGLALEVGARIPASPMLGCGGS